MGEGQMVAFVEDDEVAPGELACGAALAPSMTKVLMSRGVSRAIRSRNRR